MSARAAWTCAVFLAASWLAIAVSQLPRYGPTFDAVLGDYAYGELMYESLLDGDLDGLRFERDDPEYYGRDGHPRWKRVYPVKWVYPVPGILSAASCHLFARTLGWLDPIDAHHLIAPVSAALLSLCVFAFVRARGGGIAALLSMAFLLLHPRFFAHAMNNIKDAPTVMVVFLATAAFVRVHERERARDVVIACLLTGLGLATKINAIWPVAFFALTWIAFNARRMWRGERVDLRFACAFLLAPALIVATYLAASPQLWVDGFQRFADHARYVLVESVRVEGRDAFSWEPVQNLLFVTPPVLLALLPIGVCIWIRAKATRPAATAMLLLLLVVPIVRPCLPNMRYFNIIRHALEGIPVLAVFAGTGAAAVAGFVARRKPAGASPGAAAAISASVLVLPSLWAVLSVHPWQTTYFNALAGGFGAMQRTNRLDANDYWCHSYREGLRWINEHAEPGALVLAPVAPWMVGAVREVGLRRDLAFTEDDDAVRELIGRGLLDPEQRGPEWSAVPAVYAVFVPISKRYNLPPHSEIVRFCEDRLKPVHQIVSDGGVVLSVYRIHPS